MSRDPVKSSSKPVRHLAIIVSVVIGMMGLARLDPLVAWIAAVLGLGTLLVLFYLAGGRK